MKLELVQVKKEPEAPKILWDLLEERTAEQSISHKAMPTADEHLAFVSKPPYRIWYLIKADDEYVGTLYLTPRNEIGISIFKAKQGMGYGKAAVQKLMSRWGKSLARRRVGVNGFIANINPANERSVEFFKSMGFKLVQHTYVLDLQQ